MSSCPLVKSFSVGEGDMFYIRHASSNFTMIDCYLEGEKCTLTDADRVNILRELNQARGAKKIARFISTHPDEDHIGGIGLLTQKVSIENFYCTENSATKKDPSLSFLRYVELRSRATWITADLTRKWLNDCYENVLGDPGSSGLNFLWPVVGDKDFFDAQQKALEGKAFNNLSPIIMYSIQDGPTFMWLGDMEETFLEKISNRINWCHADVLFAPHHGRDSGKIPEAILKKISPRMIVIGEAPSDNLNYYDQYKTITQNTAGDIAFKCDGSNVDIYVSSATYEVKDDFLIDMRQDDVALGRYLGTLSCC